MLEGAPSRCWDDVSGDGNWQWAVVLRLMGGSNTSFILNG